MVLKLKPTMRLKRRYLLISNANKEEIERVILDYLGILGWAKAAPFFVSESENKVILAVNREELNNIRAAFEIALTKAKIIRVSGTLKGLKK
ncbi:MAG: hypothetical protein N3D20_01840 [Candidatus Pacearchaeota archaeon]|nr:hypothetical protein [Candidatus Pacearchaeota archaeon]